MANDRERKRELAQALLNGSGRNCDTLELCHLILADPEEPSATTEVQVAIKAAAQRLYEAIVRHTGVDLPSDICEQIMREAMADQKHEGPLTDGELQALGALSMAEALTEYLEQWPNDAAKRLRAELAHRGIL